MNRHILALQAVVFSQQLLVLLMGAELDGSIGDDSNHGGRVSPPQTEEAILQVSSVDQFVGLLRNNTLTNLWRKICIYGKSETGLAFWAIPRLYQYLNTQI